MSGPQDREHRTVVEGFRIRFAVNEGFNGWFRGRSNSTAGEIPSV